MDKRKSVLNVSVSLIFKLVTMIMSIVVKRLLINTCGNEVNGLNALYLSIIGFLAVAELGVGSAITFCMYKPIVEGDNEQVSALYQLFQRIYLAIGGFILAAGLIITPFIHTLAKDYAEISVNLHSTFILMLVSVVITYCFSSKTSLINAYKNNYITTAIASGGIVLQYVFQIATLLLTKSFNGYLICRIAAVVVQWGITEVITRRKYSHIVLKRARVKSETKKNLMQSIKAMFMHKIGGVLVNTVDSIVISTYIGVIALGKYSNYIMILNSMTGVIGLFFSSLTSIIGHMCVKENRETACRYCDTFHLINFCIGMFFFLGFYSIADDLVALLFSVDLVSERSVAFVISLNGFVQFMRTNVLTFRDATGTFYYDRWKPLFEGIVNIILSVALVKWIGVVGVIAATILTNLLICHIIEPYVLYRHAFFTSPAKYYRRNYGFVILFIIGMLLVEHMGASDFSIMRLLINGCISVGVSVVICVVVILCMWAHLVQLKAAFVNTGGQQDERNS